MHYHVVSDDNFFLRGCEEVFKKNGLVINVICLNSNSFACLNEHVQRGDVVLVNMGTHIRSQMVLERLSCKAAVAVLFVELSRRETGIPSWMKYCIPMNLPVGNLICSVDEVYQKKTSEPVLHFLSKRECEVIEGLVNGASISDLSKQLKVAKKTIYSHRRNALIKIGASSHYYYILKYKSHIIPNRLKAWF
ncbi:helix-turn-helix transcriptional regulator [Serratia marcescens]|uniref:helix-turn-helix domain-containing protein n=1 Tax=Serratia marcescens TaxID=615 RepID=UPI002730A8B5|nr:helix-turn-helix transcriptional regulator [Serratia marcescens]MDP0522288.1 helix-turn-helix transcriptional regulator [Serratia marcescens]